MKDKISDIDQNRFFHQTVNMFKHWRCNGEKKQKTKNKTNKQK